MKGAMTEPSPSTSSPPRAHIITSIGTNQYFFRARRKSQSSLTKSTISGSILLGHGSDGRITLNPIACRTIINTEAQRIFPGQPQDHAGRQQHAEEHDCQQNGVHHVGQCQPEPSPHPVERAEKRCREPSEKKDSK